MSSINSSSLMNGVLSSRHENSVKASATRTVDKTVNSKEEEKEKEEAIMGYTSSRGR